MRLKGLTEGLNTKYINLDVVTKKVCMGIFSGKIKLAFKFTFRYLFKFNF